MGERKNGKCDPFHVIVIQCTLYAMQCIASTEWRSLRQRWKKSAQSSLFSSSCCSATLQMLQKHECSKISQEWWKVLCWGIFMLNINCSPDWVKSLQRVSQGNLNWSCSGRLKAFRDVRDGNACVQFEIWPPLSCCRGVMMRMMRMHLNWISIKFHPRLVLTVQLGSCILLLTKPNSTQVISTSRVGVLHFNK